MGSLSCFSAGEGRRHLEGVNRQRTTCTRGLRRARVRSGRVRPRLATGYEIRSRGATAVRDLEMVQAGGGAVYSTTGDMARYVAALLGGGADSCGAALRPPTLAEMFEPQYQPDPRIPGMGLGFFRGQAGGHRTVGHDGDLARLPLCSRARSR